MELLKLPVRSILIYYGGIIGLMLMCAFLVANSLIDNKKYIFSPHPLENRNINLKQKLLNVQDLPLPDTNHNQTKPIFTLLVTTARSGSTWVGNLLDLIDDSFYLYEPIHSLRLDKVDFTSGFDLVEQLLGCGITPELVSDLRDWIVMYTPKNCPQNRHACTSAKAIAEDCHRSKYRSMKIIRLRLSLLEKLLTLKSMENLKIIYLIRDPRGTLASIASVKNVDKGWQLLEPSIICSKIREDFYSFQMLSTLYPNNVYLLRYEDIALNPFEKTNEMWHFINSNKEVKIPKKWYTYLRSSQLRKRRIKDPYDTIHKSTREWQFWRQTISEELYTDVVRNCDDLIQTAGYKLFDSYDQMQGSEASSLSQEKCNSLPCTGS